ncbi:hypothetical protein [Frankia sp. AvcI1]|uniref:hypothetical protein n=1 Tax=Frankia sp. AvcI1 TaxID=573496 RepID=UPI002118EF52|nr:hypothetical protein [Frankia sp. AvcI1]
MRAGRGNGDAQAPSRPYSISIVDVDGQPIETLTGWPTAQLADEHARTLTGIAGYRIVPVRQVAGP